LDKFMYMFLNVKWPWSPTRW